MYHPPEAGMTVISAAQLASRDDQGAHPVASLFLHRRLRESRTEAGPVKAQLIGKIVSAERATDPAVTDAITTKVRLITTGTS
jgi:hypothetical protein